MHKLLAAESPALLIGVVHLAPTPGSPRHRGSTGDWREGLACARRDARAYREGGADALIVENFGDAPFFKRSVPAETVAALALALHEVRAEAGELPLGVNVLRNDARAAVGLCAATGASFLRVNVHTGAMVTDQGLIEGRAAETLRERARLCPEALLFADVQVKHASPLGSTPLDQAAEETRRRGLADALILTGRATGEAAEPEHFAQVRERLPETPLFVGSGLDAGNASRYLPWIRGAIVGTSLKQDGVLENPVSRDAVRRLRDVLDARR